MYTFPDPIAYDVWHAIGLFGYNLISENTTSSINDRRAVMLTFQCLFAIAIAACYQALNERSWRAHIKKCKNLIDRKSTALLKFLIWNIVFFNLTIKIYFRSELYFLQLLNRSQTVGRLVFSISEEPKQSASLWTGMNCTLSSHWREH